VAASTNLTSDKVGDMPTKQALASDAAVQSARHICCSSMSMS